MDAMNRCPCSLNTMPRERGSMMGSGLNRPERIHSLFW